MLIHLPTSCLRACGIRNLLGRSRGRSLATKGLPLIRRALTFNLLTLVWSTFYRGAATIPTCEGRNHGSEKPVASQNTSSLAFTEKPPKENANMRMYEAARLQGFPGTYDEWVVHRVRRNRKLGPSAYNPATLAVELPLIL